MSSFMLKVFLKHSQSPRTRQKLLPLNHVHVWLISVAYQTLDNCKDSYWYIPVDFLPKNEAILNGSFQPQNTGLH